MKPFLGTYEKRARIIARMTIANALSNPFTLITPDIGTAAIGRGKRVFINKIDLNFNHPQSTPNDALTWRVQAIDVAATTAGTFDIVPPQVSVPYGTTGWVTTPNIVAADFNAVAQHKTFEPKIYLPQGYGLRLSTPFALSPVIKQRILHTCTVYGWYENIDPRGNESGAGYGWKNEWHDGIVVTASEQEIIPAVSGKHFVITHMGAAGRANVATSTATLYFGDVTTPNMTTPDINNTIYQWLSHDDLNIDTPIDDYFTGMCVAGPKGAGVWASSTAGFANKLGIYVGGFYTDSLHFDKYTGSPDDVGTTP